MFRSIFSAIFVIVRKFKKFHFLTLKNFEKSFQNIPSSKNRNFEIFLPTQKSR